MVRQSDMLQSVAPVGPFLKYLGTRVIYNKTVPETKSFQLKVNQKNTQFCNKRCLRYIYLVLYITILINMKIGPQK